MLLGQCAQRVAAASLPGSAYCLRLGTRPAEPGTWWPICFWNGLIGVALYTSQVHSARERGRTRSFLEDVGSSAVQSASLNRQLAFLRKPIARTRKRTTGEKEPGRRWRLIQGHYRLNLGMSDVG